MTLHQLVSASLVGLAACATERTGPDEAAGPDSGTPPDAPPSRDSAGDTAGDTAAPAGPVPYCRSLDPHWSAAFTDPTDAALAALIEAHGLEGDPTLYVDADGVCRRRPTPDIEAPLPELGRRLFFSLDLSGDRDVACASCHHPLLAGADALVLPAGVGFPAHAVGADRVRGTTDPARIRGARNTPSVLNVALWDHRLMWDGRVEALDPTAGLHGSTGGITTPAGPSDAPDLSTAQALMPIGHPHEMAGSTADHPDGAVGAVVARLSEDTAWQGAFEAPCAEPAALSDSWTEACTDPRVPLVTADHLALALGAYQRSLVFVDTPWSAYVQGDVTAISDAAKQGALAFFRTPADGGLNCVACHTGDFFTDEAVHAVGAPQLGPGDPLGTGTPGLDLGRAEHTADPADAFAFRTPTLLNVAHTAPYFHTGSVPTLFRAALHYRDVEESLAQTFHFPDEPFRRSPSWCDSALFVDLPDCEGLYDPTATHAGDLSTGVDGELADIGLARDTSSELVVQFLEALTDPRVASPDALSPWVLTTDTGPTPSPTSDEGPERCREMVAWPLTQDLRVKGLRWLATGDLPPGATAATDARPLSLFGEGYWQVFGQRFRLRTGLDSRADSLAAGVLSLMAPAERDALWSAWTDQTWLAHLPAHAEARQAVVDAMATGRSLGTPPDPDALRDRIDAVYTSDLAGTTELAAAYASAWAALSAVERTERRAQLRRFLDGSLDDLPDGVYTPGSDTLTRLPELEAELSARGLTLDAGLSRYVFAYATWTAGPDCTAAFDARQDFGSRAAPHYGFATWIDGWFFNLDTGDQDPRAAQAELADLVGRLEAEAGFTGTPAAVDATTTAHRAWTTARRRAAAATRALGDAWASGDDPAAAHTELDAAREALVAAETSLLHAELSYYLSLWDALSATQRADIEAWIACLESPETQALRGSGGFDAVGGSCLP